MDLGANRPPLQVLGEHEALQQFFSGQDVGGVLDSSVAVDTSILEQYLCNDMDPSSFMLPESPPDSNSEACSPPQIPDLGYDRGCWSTQPKVFQPATRSASCHFQDQGSAPSTFNPATRPLSCQFKAVGSAPSQLDPLPHGQLHNLGLTNTFIKSGSPPAPLVPPVPLHQDTHHSAEHYLNPESCLKVYTPPTPPSPSLPSSNNYVSSIPGPVVVPNVLLPTSNRLLGSASTVHTCSQDSKKRRRSESEEASAGETTFCESDGTRSGAGTTMNGLGLGSSQLLTWEPYRTEHWSTLYNCSYQTLSPPAFHINTDKGFNYSTADEAFVCQKKNHFQVTVHIGVATEPHFVRTPNGHMAVDHFQLQVFGVKLETPSQQVTIEQSQPDRTKKPFHPVRVSLTAGKISKVTLGRLHFSETTSNNMRKKGKPNPDQRYFQMVVGLYAAVREETFLLTALVSERIIVRASNPGQFEMDSDTLWQRGAAQEAVVCQGRVGVNTDAPDEALVVCGNAKVMGAIIQPSDSRAKQNIQEVDSEQQLKRITQMRLVEFDYKPEFASVAGIDQTHQTGVIAQEVKELLPSAVKEAGDVVCSDGERIQNLLMVDKEQIFMENVGAVQQLSKLTDDLETRIQELEVWNRHLAKLKSLTGSLRSTGKPQRHPSVSTSSGSESCTPGKVQTKRPCRKYKTCLQNKLLQAGVFTLLLTMALCLISISAFYLVILKHGDFDLPSENSNSSEVPALTTASTTTVLWTRPPGSWPPDVNFCDLLYCDQVYCCPSPAGGGADSNITATESAGKMVTTAIRAEKHKRHLKRARDWKNTTIHTFRIKENQQVIDSRYCLRDECGPDRYVFRVPVSQFVPVNMRVTLLMNSTELLVVHLCALDEPTTCSSLLDKNTFSGSRGSTSGLFTWLVFITAFITFALLWLVKPTAVPTVTMRGRSSQITTSTSTDAAQTNE